MLATLEVALPATKSQKQRSVEFTPTAGDFSAVAGVMVIRTDRGSAAYTVEPYPSIWEGRAFLLRKLTDGTDAEAGHYDVFIGQSSLCDCKGHAAHGVCKHVAAIVAAIDAGWL